MLLATGQSGGVCALDLQGKGLGLEYTATQQHRTNPTQTPKLQSMLRLYKAL